MNDHDIGQHLMNKLKINIFLLTCWDLPYPEWPGILGLPGPRPRQADHIPGLADTI